MPALDDVTTAPVVQLYLNRNGNVGVGTTSPVANLEVIGTVRLGPTHVSGGDLSLDSSRALRGKQIFVQSEGGLYLNALEGGGTVHVGGWEGSVSSIAVSGSAAIKGAIELGESSSAGINGAFIDFHGGFGRSSEDFNVRLANDADRSLSLHGGSLVVGEGEITTRALNITGGSDLAWRFKVSDAKGLSSSSQEHTIPQPGMLVSIDRSADGRLQVSHGAYDSAVAGVISGAGDIHVGMTMGQSGSMADGDTPVTSTGRVWVWADATYGAISRGDRLTSSETPGHAMKVADRERGDGTSIGKAMSELKSGKGLVLVWMSMN